MTGRSDSVSSVITHLFRKDHILSRRERAEHLRPTSATSLQEDTRDSTMLSQLKPRRSSVFSVNLRKPNSRRISSGSMPGPSRAGAFLGLFHNLPAELKIQIFCNLQMEDLLSFRAVCCVFHDAVRSNASSVGRHLFRYGALNVAVALYPIPTAPESISIEYVLSVSHRIHVVHHLAHFIAAFTMTKFHRYTSPDQMVECRTKTINMIRNMRPLLLMIFHFFENYRIARTKSNNMDRAITSEDELVEVETRIMELYEPNDLYQAHAMYKFLILVITRKLRPPTYAGKMERSLRGWRQKPATSAEMAKLVVLGGLEAVAEVVKCDSYRARRTTLDKFLSRVLPPEEHDQRAKRSLPLLSSRISTSADTTNIKKKAKSIVKSDVTASQNKTPCLIMLPLNPNEAFELSNSLPDFNNLWYHAATKVLIKNGTVDSDDDLPCTRRFITYLETTREVENGDEHGNDGGGDDIPDTENDESIGESGDEAGDMETQL